MSTNQSTENWYGLVSREYAAHMMMAPSVAGGFIATDMPVDDPEDPWHTMYYAMIPAGLSQPKHGSRMNREEFRAALIEENSHQYLGTDEDYADGEGFATEDRISNLLGKIDADV